MARRDRRAHGGWAAPRAHRPAGPKVFNRVNGGPAACRWPFKLGRRIPIAHMGTARRPLMRLSCGSALPDRAVTNDSRESKEHRMQLRRVVLGLAVVIAAPPSPDAAGLPNLRLRFEAARSPSPPHPVSQDERGILATVDALQTASRKGDGRTVCGDFHATAGALESRRPRPAAVPRRCASGSVRAGYHDLGRQGHQGDRRPGTAVIRETNGNVSTLFLVKRGRPVAHLPRDAAEVRMSPAFTTDTEYGAQCPPAVRLRKEAHLIHTRKATKGLAAVARRGGGRGDDRMWWRREQRPETTDGRAPAPIPRRMRP